MLIFKLSALVSRLWTPCWAPRKDLDVFQNYEDSYVTGWPSSVLICCHSLPFLWHSLPFSILHQMQSEIYVTRSGPSERRVSGGCREICKRTWQSWLALPSLCHSSSAKRTHPVCGGALTAWPARNIIRVQIICNALFNLVESTKSRSASPLC